MQLESAEGRWASLAVAEEQWVVDKVQERVLWDSCKRPEKWLSVEGGWGQKAVEMGVERLKVVVERRWEAKAMSAAEAQVLAESV